MTVYRIASVAEFSADELRETLDLLSDTDRARLFGKTQAAFNESLAARALLRRLCTENGIEYKLGFSENGKPELQNAFAGISHSRGRVAAVISEYPVGIDIEYTRRIRLRKKYMLFCGEECRFVNSAPQCSDNRFLFCWTRKEAYVKLIGGSLVDAASLNSLAPPGGLRFETKLFGDYSVSVCEKISEL